MEKYKDIMLHAKGCEKLDQNKNRRRSRTGDGDMMSTIIQPIFTKISLLHTIVKDVISMIYDITDLEQLH